MAYNENIADRIRESLVNESDVLEKHMFGGVCFMVNGKMCVGVMKEDMMCRVGEAAEVEALERGGCRPVDFAKTPMKGYVYVDETGMKTKKDFDHWIALCLDFNPLAKATKKKIKKGSA